MKKILNRPEDFVEETLEGIYAAHPGFLRPAGDDPRVLIRADAPVQGKVGLATGGGSGHLPVFLGYVGSGMLDGCAVGDVFASPSSDRMLEVAKRIDGGKGVVQIFGNYSGDVMNFEMAAELAGLDGIEVRSVVVKDDVASAPAAEADRRRGVAGMVFAFKIAGAAADRGDDIDAVVAVTERALAGVRSMGVALSPCIVPRTGEPSFQLGDDEMEIGMGIHGEPGVKRDRLADADAIVDRLASEVLDDLNVVSGQRLAVMVNGLGATPREELYIMYRRLHQILEGRGVTVHRAYVGEYATSMEMAGASITVFRLDDELQELLDAPADTPFFTQAGR